jgi:hypothetical protein
MSLAPGDLVEVLGTPPAGFTIHPNGRKFIGQLGVVVSAEYPSPTIKGIGLHDVRFAQKTIDVATCLLRKISGTPEDSHEWGLTDIPTLTDAVS